MTPEEKLALDKQRIESWFSNLLPDAYTITSRQDPVYNCIAYAVGIRDRWWWPPVNPRTKTYWPPGAPKTLTIEAFIKAFETRGFVKCDNGNLEEGFIKAAIYAKNGVPRHAAKQCSDGTWSSKLGRTEDITHSIYALTGNEYGQIVVFLKKPVRSKSSAK